MCRRTRLSSDASEINFVAGSAAALAQHYAKIRLSSFSLNIL
jgi:hypothetical protein